MRPPLPHKQLHHLVAERLRRDILDGRLKPGEWLRQERLAHEQRVSQMPVREALKQLASEGLVEHVPYRGVRVVQFAIEDVEDLYACRTFIEGMAAGFAAARVSEEELRELTDLHDRMARCHTPADLAEYRELNRRFHEIIYQASGRSYLVRTLAALWAAFPTMLWSNFQPVATGSVPGREQPDVEEHGAIIAALRAGDGPAAEAAMRRHIESAGKALLNALRGAS